jgi:hypothetical protein
VIARAAALLALTFVLPGSVLLRQYAQRRSEALQSDLKVSAKLSLWGDDARAFAQRAGQPMVGEMQDHLELAARLTLSQQRCVLELGSAERPLGQLANDGSRLQGADPSSAAGLAGAIAIAADGCVPFLSRGSGGDSGLAGFLQEHGGDPREVSLTRFDGKVAYAIGGPASGTGKVVLVIAQDSLLPLRLMVRDTGLIDVHYGEYRSVGYSGLPGIITVTRDGAPLATLEVLPPAR